MSLTALDLVAARIIDPLSYARPGAAAADALRELRSRRTPALPVIDSGRQVGSVGAAMLEAVAAEEGAVCVRNVMDGPLPELDETATVDDVREMMSRAGAVVVTRERFAIGLLTSEDVDMAT